MAAVMILFFVSYLGMATAQFGEFKSKSLKILKSIIEICRCTGITMFESDTMRRKFRLRPRHVSMPAGSLHGQKFGLRTSGACSRTGVGCSCATPNARFSGSRSSDASGSGFTIFAVG